LKNRSIALEIALAVGVCLTAGSTLAEPLRQGPPQTETRISAILPNKDASNALDQALADSMRDRSNSLKSERLRALMLRSPLSFELPNSAVSASKRLLFDPLKDRTPCVLLKIEGMTYLEVFTNLSEARKDPKRRYVFTVDGRGVIDLARRNGWGIIVNPYSLPAFTLTPPMVAAWLTGQLGASVD
jgi:hypothetical protein